jgi:hypothetical protein
LLSWLGSTIDSGSSDIPENLPCISAINEQMVAFVLDGINFGLSIVWGFSGRCQNKHSKIWKKVWSQREGRKSTSVMAHPLAIVTQARKT